MPKKDIPGFADARAAKAKVDALTSELETANAVLKEAEEASVQRIRRGESSGDVIADALLVGGKAGDRQVEEVLRTLQERLLSSEGQLFLFGHHRWAEYDETSSELDEYEPAEFYIGLVPKGGLKVVRPYGTDNRLAIPAGWHIKVQPYRFGGSGSFATWPFQDWNLGKYVDVPIGGWKKYPPLLLIGEEEIRQYYKENGMFAELVLALKSGKSGVKEGKKLEPLRADERSKPIIKALPLPALELA